MRSRGAVGLRWIVLLDGATWAGLALLSALALYDRVSPPWLLIVLWFALHPAIALAYLATKWSLHYPRYVWSIRGWTLSTSWLWLYQTLFFVHHIVAEGFFAPLGRVDALSAAVAASIALHAWFDAFWAEVVQPFELVRLGDVIRYRDRLATSKKE